MLMSLILKSKAVEVEEGSKGSVSSDATSDVEVLDVSSDDEDENDEDYIENKVIKPKVLSGTTSKSCGTTLVIAPLSLISQWEEEVASKTNLTALLYYDNSSKKLARGDSFAAVDVVITTCKCSESQAKVFCLDLCHLTASTLLCKQTALFKVNMHHCHAPARMAALENPRLISLCYPLVGSESS